VLLSSRFTYEFIGSISTNPAANPAATSATSTSTSSKYVRVRRIDHARLKRELRPLDPRLEVRESGNVRKERRVNEFSFCHRMTQLVSDLHHVERYQGVRENERYRNSFQCFNTIDLCKKQKKKQKKKKKQKNIAHADERTRSTTKRGKFRISQPCRPSRFLIAVFLFLVFLARSI
jgi:hypothetical protein